MISCINKIAKLSSQYLDLIKQVKKSDYIRGFNTSVSYAQLKELENIRDRLDGNSNPENLSQNELIKSIHIAVQEIEDILMNQLDQYSIPEIVDFIKKQFYQVFTNSKSEIEENLITQNDEVTQRMKFNENETLEGVKEKLDFQNAINDLTKNYEWIKEKSTKSLSALEDKYDQISRELSELNQRISTFSIHDNIGFKNQRPTSNKLMSQLKDTEKKIILNVLNDIFGLVKYTDESVRTKIDFSYEDIETLKESITEYQELLEDKIKTLPTIISSGNLKQAIKNKKEDDLYQLYLVEQDRSDKNISDVEDKGRDENANEEIRKLSEKVSKWRKYHKILYDEVNNNSKLMRRLFNKKSGGKDSVSLLKQLYKDSNNKVHTILKEQYILHYTVSKSKSRTKRENIEVLHTIQNTKENKSEEMLDVASEGIQANESLINRINYLRSEIGDLKQFKETAEEKDRELESLKSKYSELNIEYKSERETSTRLQNDLNLAKKYDKRSSKYK